MWSVTPLLMDISCVFSFSAMISIAAISNVVHFSLGTRLSLFSEERLLGVELLVQMTGMKNFGKFWLANLLPQAFSNSLSISNNIWESAWYLYIINNTRYSHEASVSSHEKWGPIRAAGEIQRGILYIKHPAMPLLGYKRMLCFLLFHLSLFLSLGFLLLQSLY